MRQPKVNGRAVSPISRTFPTEAEAAIEWREVTMAEQRRLRSARPTAGGLTLAAWSEMYPVGSPGVRPGAHHLSGVLRAAEVAELVATPPARYVRLPRGTEPPREIRAWSPAQVTAFLSHPTVKAGPPRPLLIVAFDTGVRRGELLGLTPADLHLDGPRPYTDTVNATDACPDVAA